MSSVEAGRQGTRVFSGGIWEERYGYARAVVAGPWVLVSGSTAAVDGEVVHVGDARGQALTALDIALAAVEEAGAGREDVVRVRFYVVDQHDFDAVGTALGERFGDVRPACTGVRVAGLVDPRMLVEIEVEAYRGDRW
ncbi:Enamine deaminase RidA, house cleaning of reactive enamine intermediates, YjgF/YER057c/UK114 family [Sinosporangium album]|uniref:Enamine deaminase RidA, house cleaning of reactive enamine intermediates, YjgF/YER057c/UK114 family n=1 Tax=Sinosporangium album TaxID=504805 RepID=A0A1G7XB87_9ACTN|nr:RidA family protein [Sinosporangium album]SDG80810.1 Enamine deaminase RidA, house cleaning of reactive enamine intermediates, YjgF/YER057c/UK114 family [Sinosporangium album]